MTRARVVAAALIATLSSACALPPIDLAGERSLPLRTTIYASDGSRLARLYVENRALMRIADVPRHLIDAVLAAEDARFYNHDGYDVRSIARAAIVNADRGEITQGGSTITQQYVKNVFFHKPGRTWERKARELRLAIEVERRFSKDEILERYLNTVYLGEGAYGVKAGAETYFGKEVRDLTLPESALLAALIKAPAFYDPRVHRARGRVRRDYVIRRMADLGMIDLRAAARARAAPIDLVPIPPRVETRQPYFVEAVKREVTSDTALGATEGDRATALWKGGLTIETTLDLEMQAAAERAVDRILGERSDPHVALVAIRPKTGEIVAMVGGRSWKASQVNLALGRAGGGSGRQSGSAFKPIVAAAAMEQGIHLDTLYDSGPVVFTFDDGTSWPVGNVEGGGGGRMSLHEALVRSVNGVYARLSVAIGANRIAGMAQNLGVRSRLPMFPSIGLGSAEVSVLDMATAYATLANGGTYVEPTTIKSIKTPAGGVVRPDQEEIPAISPGNAYLLTKALEQVIVRGTGTAAQIGRPAAGKTGTTNDHADAWFVGYTPDLVAAVWVGYPQGRISMTSVRGVTVFGGTFPAQIWRAFMTEALEGVPPRPFRFPKRDLVSVWIDPRSGLLAAPWCRPAERRRMLRDLVPLQYCPRPAPAPFVYPSPVYGTPGPPPADDGRRRDDYDFPSENESPKPRPEPSPDEDPSPEPSPEPTE